ncbi:MAG: chromate transporter [Firmicutes bacterium]|nr:chromate transporter [Bacillota bacterium]
MIYLQLFWTFFKIGLFTIGGGQAMIPMISQEVVEKGWLTLDEVQSFIAISESTPGPFAVNIATYTGVSVLQSAGVGESILGAICATFGVVLPSLVIITLIALAFSNFIKKPAVQSVFVYVRSTVTGLLIAVFVGFVLSTLLGVSSVLSHEPVQFDVIGTCLFALLFGLSLIRIKGKTLQPIWLIIISAVIGTLCYGFIPV